MTDEKPHLSVHQISMLARCAKQWEFRYVRGMKAPPGVAATIGKGTHRAIELDLGQKMSWGMLLDTDELQTAARDATVREWERETPVVHDGDPDKGEATDTAVALATLHHKRRAPTIDPIALEQSFRIEVPGLPHDIEGVKDIVTPTQIIDTKTSGKRPKEDALERSIQMPAYHLAESLAGHPERTVSLDYLVKTQIPDLRTLGPMTFDASDHHRFLRRVELASKVVTSGIFQPADADKSWWCSQKWCGYWDACEFGARKAVSVGLIDPKTLTSRLVPHRHRDTDTDADVAA